MQQQLPTLQHEDWFTPCLPSHPGAPQGEGHWADFCHLQIRWAATDPPPHARCFRLPQLHAELALLGEVFGVSKAPKTPAHPRDESPECVVVGETPLFTPVGPAP